MYPCASTLVPSRGVSAICDAFIANSAQRSWATLSRSVKYTWPCGEIVAWTTSPSTHRSLNSSPDWICVASRVTTWPTRRIPLGALEILTGPRIDLDLVSALDEQRNVDAQTRLDRRRLGGPGRRVALEPELRLGDRQHDRRGEVDADGRSLVFAQHRRHSVGEVAHGVAELIRVERDLVVRGGVHEVIVRAIPIEELHGAVVEPRALETISRLERALDNVALPHVAELHAHLRAAAPELDVLELDDLIQVAVELDGHAALDLTGADHALR